jgi:pimeloyl-ACP methyl ester carboxylesterase
LIPFVPEFVYPFYLAYVLILLPAVLIRERELLIRSAIAFAVLILVSCSLFVILPVHVPRPMNVPDSVAGMLVERIYRADRPVCAFPSLHVSTSLLAAVILMREYRLVGLLSLAFFFLTSVSTLFIKQHVFLDALGGVIMALAADWLVLRGRIDTLTRSVRAALLNIRTMKPRSGGEKGRRLAESRKTTAGGVEYDSYESGTDTGRVFILLHGVTLQGERDPRLINFSRALAESGIRAAVIALPALKQCRFDMGDVEAIIDLATELNSESGKKVGIIGFSLGGGLALRAAADPRISEFIDPLLLFGPYYSLPEVWGSIVEKSTSAPRDEKGLDDFIWLRLVMAYRVLDLLNLDDKDKQELIDLLESYCFKPPLERKRRFFERVLSELDINQMAVHAETTEDLEDLSPMGKLTGLNSRVLILHDKYDNLIPHGQSEKIIEELRSCNPDGTQKLLVTPLLVHVTAGSLWRIFDVFRILAIMGEIFR